MKLIQWTSQACSWVIIYECLGTSFTQNFTIYINRHKEPASLKTIMLHKVSNCWLCCKTLSGWWKKPFFPATSRTNLGLTLSILSQIHKRTFPFWLNGHSMNYLHLVPGLEHSKKISLEQNSTWHVDLPWCNQTHLQNFWKIMQKS
jgi:hypothetical protein